VSRKRPGGPAKGPGGARLAHVRVKTARGRKLSSTRWLERQLNDPYVAEARRLGYRSRAAFKLLQIDARYRLLKPGLAIVDLGCAPGGWLQIARAAAGGNARIAGIDLLPVDPVADALLLQADFMAEDAPAALVAALGVSPDLVLSDMAPELTGHARTDHWRVAALAEAAAQFACATLTPGGAFAAKVFSGGAGPDLLRLLKRDFARVSHFKPDASRKESAEIYVIAQGFRGRQTGEGPENATEGDG